MTQLAPADPRSDRIIASPYARKLARERGVPLSGLPGSGPGGRIVAGDVRPRTAPATVRDPDLVAMQDPTGPRAANTAPQPMPARRVGAFASTLDVASAKALIEQIEATNAAVRIDDLLIKALAAAMAHIDLAPITLSWRDTRGPTVFTGADRSTLGRIAGARDAGDRQQDGIASAPLLVSRIREVGLRPTQATLAPGLALRLTLAGADAGPLEALLTYDEDLVPEPQAARFLAHLRDSLALPFRLLV